MNKFLKKYLDWEFYGILKKGAPLDFYILQAGGFFYFAYVFASWDFSMMGHMPEEAFQSLNKEIVYYYWKTPLYYYLSLQFIYEWIPHPTPNIYFILQGLVVLTSFFGLIGIKPKLMAPLVFILASHLFAQFLVINNTLDATTLLSLCLMFILCLSHSKSFYVFPFFKAQQAKQADVMYHWPKFLFLYAVSHYYAVAGFAKVFEIGWDWPLQLHLDRFSINAIEKNIFKNDWWTLVDFSLILTSESVSIAIGCLSLIGESLFPLTLFSRVLRPLFIFSLIGMHFGIYLNHGFNYFGNILMLFLLLDHHRFLSRIAPKRFPSLKIEEQ